MEKRFVAFVLASVLIMAGFMVLQQFFGPKRQPKQPIPLAKKDEDAEKKPNAEKKPGNGKNGEVKKPAEEPKVKPEVPETPEPPQERISLGSLDPADPFWILLTLNNRGGALERIELASPKYLNLEDRNGYLGHLALTKAPGRGCVVNAVGRGTPAALATASGTKGGLQPGDILRAVDGEEIDVPADLEDYLKHKKIKPKQAIQLSVRRGSGGRTVDLEFTAILARRPLEMVSPEFGTADDLSEQHPLSMLLTLQSIGPSNDDGTTEGATKIKRGASEISGLPSLLNRRWNVKKLTGASGVVEGVEFRFTLDEEALQAIGQFGQLEIVKRYRLAPSTEEKTDDAKPKAYHLEFDIEIINKGDKPQQVAYRMYGPNGQTLEGWWYQNKIHPGWASAGARDVIWKTTGRGHGLMGCPQIYDNAIAKEPKQTPLFASGAEEKIRDVHYVGVDAQYFTTALIPYDAREGGATTHVFDTAEAIPATPDVRKDKAGRKITNVTFQLSSLPNKIEAGKSFKQSFLLYAGPKDEKILAHYGLGKTIEYGWFGWVSWPLSQLLHAFYYYLVPNYGVAIILLTLLVRGCLFPIGRRMAKNMQAMQDLAPEIRAIKEKYKDDLAKQGKAQQELFRKNKINPYAGCLPLFLQMPIFIGLYRALSVDISLRQAELIPGISWASNLAGPDMLWWWKPYLWDMLGGEYGYLGPYFNVFPLVTAGLFLLQQYLFTPPPTDEQQEMQQKMMYFMTIFMSIMFFKVPAGLCVYFITSSLWGVAERTLMMPKKKGGAGAANSAAPKKTPDKSGSNGATKSEESRKKQKSR